MGNPLSSSQVADLARPLLGMVDTILEYYKDPAHEKSFQEWYQKWYVTKHRKECEYRGNNAEIERR